MVTPLVVPEKSFNPLILYMGTRNYHTDQSLKCCLLLFLSFPNCKSRSVPRERPLKPVTIHRALLEEDMIDIFRDAQTLEYDVDITIIGTMEKKRKDGDQGYFERC